MRQLLRQKSVRFLRTHGKDEQAGRRAIKDKSIGR